METGFANMDATSLNQSFRSRAHLFPLRNGNLVDALGDREVRLFTFTPTEPLLAQ